MGKTSLGPSPFNLPNIRGFIAFRLFFNARFYYPVFTVLFLDFGLSLSQFALLNTAWALTIVGLEVPSGALADLIGRKKLLIVSAGLMILEMGLLVLAPREPPDLLFAVFLANRFLSGAAEAAASGADEALAYDSLKDQGLTDHWGRVLEVQMRVQSLGYIVVMILGAAVYDPVFVGRVLRWSGWGMEVTQGDTLKLPVVLTLIMGLATLAVALKLQEAHRATPHPCSFPEGCGRSIVGAFRVTFSAGKWILGTPFALVTILTGLLFDHVIRMVITLNSQYYRIIGIPEAAFGIIGSCIAILGVFIPRLARKLVQRRSPPFNAMIMFVITSVGLTGIALVIPWFGLLPVILLFCVMFMMNLFISQYLNQITESHQRATVLSFKGLSFNLAYAAIGLLYSLLIAVLKGRAVAVPTDAATGLENLAFVSSLMWFPVYFCVGFGVLVLFARNRLKDS
jgi:MFS family permease